MPPKDDLVDTARALTEGMYALSEEIQGLKSYGHRNRRLIRLTILGLCIDVILSILLSLGFVQVNDIAHKADKNARTQKTTCLSSNEARAGNIQLWEHVLDLSAQTPRPNETPDQRAEQQQQTDQFRAYIHHLFAPRDCNHLSK